MPSTTSLEAYSKLIKFDVWGVWLVNAGAAVNLTLLLLPCTGGEGGQRWLRLALITLPVIGSFAWVAFTAKDVKSRATAFAVCWLTRVCTIIASVSFAPWPGHLLTIHLLAELAPAIGAYINVKRWPESRFPGRLDYFNSHTLMHLLVAIGMLGQHWLSMTRIQILTSSMGQESVLQCSRQEWGATVLQGVHEVQLATTVLRRLLPWS
jgi:hypothetical protein